MFESMTSAERIELAKVRMKKAHENFLYLLQLNANNQFVVYHPTLARQIKFENAARAFDAFRRSMYQIEIVRLCALWDTIDKDREKSDREKECLPLVVELIDNPAVIKELAATAGSQYRPVDFQGSSHDVAKALAAGRNKSQAKRARAGLKRTIARARWIMASSRLESLVNARDKHVAHSLAATRREKKKSVAAIARLDGRHLLKQSAPIVQALYLWVSGKSFSIANSKRIAGKNAQALWRGCKFKAVR
jgi:HEPN superfamily AbiU2-like protein